MCAPHHTISIDQNDAEYATDWSSFAALALRNVALVVQHDQDMELCQTWWFTVAPFNESRRSALGTVKPIVYPR